MDWKGFPKVSVRNVGDLKVMLCALDGSRCYTEGELHNPGANLVTLETLVCGAENLVGELCREIQNLVPLWPVGVAFDRTRVWCGSCPSPPAPPPWSLALHGEHKMSALVKLVLGDSLQRLVCCVPRQTDGETPGISNTPKLSAKDYQRHLQELAEEKKKRDEQFAQKKAERAAMRIHLREKYQLRQNEKDVQQLRAAGERVELAAIAKVGRSPENSSSLLGELPGLQDINLTELTNKAQASINQHYQTAQQQCALM